MRLGIIANIGKPRAAEVLRAFLDWLDDHNTPFVVATEILSLLERKECASLPGAEIGPNVDFVLSFGGDGTFLQTARLVAPAQTPIIGVNLGGFGYLAEVAPLHLQQRILDITDGRYLVQERMMLLAQAEGDDRHFPALNDVVIDKGGFARTMRLETFVDGEFLNTFNSDGLIVATPTGSTGYSLSAGGPILEPRLSGMVVNPICPHTLANRPLVVHGDSQISIRAYCEMGVFQLAVDGQQVMELPSGSRVAISRAPFHTKIIHFQDSSFFRALRTKLQWRNQSWCHSERSEESP